MPDQPQIMGIINVTPNSFFEAGKTLDPQAAIEHGLRLFEEGADILDVGGCSTNPYSSHIPSIEEEIQRTVPVVQALCQKTPLRISIDTYRPEVAERALDAGAQFINDIQGFTNPKMRQIAQKYQVPICIMHMQNQPHNMQLNPQYPDGVVEEITSWLRLQTDCVIQEGVNPKNIYIDPGIGFGKSLADNFEILQNLDRFKALGFPILIGLSRKTFLYKTLGISTEESLPATLAMHAYYYPQMDLMRVHDVKAHREMVTILNLASQAPKVIQR